MFGLMPFVGCVLAGPHPPVAGWSAQPSTSPVGSKHSRVLSAELFGASSKGTVYLAGPVLMMKCSHGRNTAHGQ